MQEKLSFPSDGLKLSGVLHVPEQRRAGERLPAFIVLHGFVGTKDESHAELQARMLEDFGYCAFRIDMRGCGESEGTRGQVRCFDQVADTKNALTFIAEREEVDPKRIGVIGHSFGAAVAVYTAGIDERFACVISSCGWGDGERKFRGQHPRRRPGRNSPTCWSRGAGTSRTPARACGSRASTSCRSPKPAQESVAQGADGGAGRNRHQHVRLQRRGRRCNIAPRPLLLFHTANDIITPTEQSIRLFEKAGQPAELMLINGTSHFPLSQQDAPRTRVLIRSWLDRFFPTALRARE